MDTSKKPKFIIIGGPNGSGKSTLYDGLKRRGLLEGPFLNPDVYAAKYIDQGWSQGRANVAAGRKVLKQTSVHIENKTSFIRESTLSGKEIIRSAISARLAGFLVELYFVGANGLDDNIARVDGRVKMGGHDIPIEDQKRRYDRCFTNGGIVSQIATKTAIFFNGLEGPQYVAFGIERSKIQRNGLDAPGWIDKLAAVSLALSHKPTKQIEDFYSKLDGQDIDPKSSSLLKRILPMSDEDMKAALERYRSSLGRKKPDKKD